MSDDVKPANPKDLRRERDDQLLKREIAYLKAEICGLQAPPSNPEDLRRERDDLLLKREIAYLKAEICGLQAPRTLRAPVWQSGPAMTGIAAILAAILPVTASVQGWFQKSRELELERERQTEQVRTSYLDRMKTPGEHQRTLNFLIATTPDGQLRTWAIEERKRVRDELEKFNNDADAQAKMAQEERQRFFDAIKSAMNLDPKIREEIRLEELRRLMDASAARALELKREQAMLAAMEPRAGPESDAEAAVARAAATCAGSEPDVAKVKVDIAKMKEATEVREAAERKAKMEAY